MARPQDIGDQFPSDAFAHNTQDVSEGRQQYDYGTRPNFIEGFDPVNFQGGGSQTFEVAEYSVVAVFDDAIVANEITRASDGSEQVSTLQAFISKPEQLRKTYYDTDGMENAAGEIIESLTASTRRITVGTAIRIEEIQPAYVVGDKIFGARSQFTGSPSITLVDVNADGRRWKNQEPDTKYFQITDINKDTYTCQEWDTELQAQKVTALGALLDAVEVAKPTTLRGSSWNGQTIDGVLYTVVGGATEADSFNVRNADSTEEVIVQSWVPGTTIINAKFMPLGTGASYSSTEAMWQDTNTGGFTFISLAVSTPVRAKWDVSASATPIASGTSEFADFFGSGTQVFNQGSGFSLDSDSYVTVLAPAAGVVRITAQVDFTIPASDPPVAYLRGRIVKNPGVVLAPILAEQSQQGIDNSLSPNPGGVVNHSHEALTTSGGTPQHISLNFSVLVDLAEGDEISLEGFQINADSTSLSMGGTLTLEFEGSL